MEASAIFGRLFAAIAAIVLLYILYTVLKQAWAHHQPLQQNGGSSTFSIWKWGRQPSRRQYAPLDLVLEEEEGAEDEEDDLRSYHDSNSVNATPVEVQGPWRDEDAWEESPGQNGQQQGRRSLSAGVVKPLPERPLPDKPLPPVPETSKGKG